MIFGWICAISTTSAPRRSGPLLLSLAPNLLSLQIKNIRLICYMPPEEMVGALAGLTKLRAICIGFSRSFNFPPQGSISLGAMNRHPPSLVRIIFPDLTKFQISGYNEYLNDLVALIDAPQLEDLSVESSKIYGNSDTGDKIVGNLFPFISRTATFMFTQFGRAELTLDPRRCITYVKFDLPQGECQQARLSLTVSDRHYWSQWKAPSSTDIAVDVNHVLGQLAFMLSDVQHLSIKRLGSEDEEQDEFILEKHNLGFIWLQLLRSFIAVDVFRVSRRLAGSIASAINGAPGRTVTPVLPALQVLWLDDKVRKGKLMASIEEFLYWRKQSGHPVVISTRAIGLLKDSTLNPH